MFRVITLLLLVGLNAGLSYGMQCSFGEKNIFQKLFDDSCPGLLNSADKTNCCYNIKTSTYYCCDNYEFAMLSAETIITTGTIVVIVIVLSAVIFCVSCLCCIFRRCCRRQQGIVYGRPSAA